MNAACYRRNKYLTYDVEDVLEFESEHALYERMDNSDNPKPIFVKFFERWCEHCKRLKEVARHCAPCVDHLAASRCS